MSRKSKTRKLDPASANFQLGMAIIWAHPIFETLHRHTHVWRTDDDTNLCLAEGWATIERRAYMAAIHVHPTRRAEPEEWAYVLAHCLLHLGFGHFQVRENPRAWNAACDLYIAKFLADLKFGQLPQISEYRVELTGHNEEQLYRRFCEEGIPNDAPLFSMSGSALPDMIMPEGKPYSPPIPYESYLAQGLAAAVSSAVNVVAGVQTSLTDATGKQTPAQLARSWFISSFPLLGALAAAFKIIEDGPLCIRMGISVAAVDAEAREVYFNPSAGLDADEYRFVMAHELLHVGLSHHTRREGRDPYLWNVACDYVINAWLIEMGIGAMPRIGGLHDPELKGESAESVYDRVVTDMRRYRKLMTLRGVGVGDMLTERIPDWWKSGDGMSLDEFYRRCLAQGLDYHSNQGRGFLPAGLIEEIQALSQPPISWDVQLANWFDHYFAPLEKMRSYARLSRRQSSTPDIPRPHWIPKPGAEDGRTFGVVLDTSGSMDRHILAKALGAIASYSLSHEVAAARVVFCDAAPYDEGYMPPEAIAHRVRIKGRGGTILQPGIDLLERAEDFPKNGPLLIITDGLCDRLTIRRDHAFLMPQGRYLPFVPRGQVFRIE